MTAPAGAPERSGPDGASPRVGAPEQGSVVRSHPDLDHAHPYEHGGSTACWNLCCLCRRHHRIKTHARDWSFTLTRDGRLVVTTPAGVTRTTRPPGWSTDPEPDPPWLDEQAPPDVRRL